MTTLSSVLEPQLDIDRSGHVVGHHPFRSGGAGEFFHSGLAEHTSRCLSLYVRWRMVEMCSCLSGGASAWGARIEVNNSAFRLDVLRRD